MCAISYKKISKCTKPLGMSPMPLRLSTFRTSINISDKLLRVGTYVTILVIICDIVMICSPNENVLFTYLSSLLISA